MKSSKTKKKFSGKIIIRMTPELHEKVAKYASKMDMSMNLFMNIAINHEVKKISNRDKRRMYESEE